MAEGREGEEGKGKEEEMFDLLREVDGDLDGVLKWVE